mmetsp:Transcript_16958/g.18937  ORF Transcript_16958/g.18937 Transcript_16958/m.18937 type:complete len:82 (+) Transcript_16958:198-443(+)
MFQREDVEWNQNVEKIDLSSGDLELIVSEDDEIEIRVGWVIVSENSISSQELEDIIDFPVFHTTDISYDIDRTKNRTEAQP